MMTRELHFYALGRELFLLGHDDVGKWLADILGRDTIVLGVDIVLFEDIVDEDGTDGFDFASLLFAEVDLFFIFLIFDIPEYLLEDILHRDDSSSPTMLIEDECDMAT